jgi:di/tricarboxylate transporter
MTIGRRQGSLVSDHVISIIGLVLVFLVATTFSVHMGVLALVAAFVVGTAFAEQSTDDIFSGFPGDLFVVLVGVTFLFAIARNNGTVDWLVHMCMKATGGRAALMPWVMFLVTALLAGVGAVTPAAVGIIAPIGMSVARRYGINPLLMGVLIINGGSAGGFSPIGVYGTITNGVVERNDLPGSPGLVFLYSLLFNLLLNTAAFLLFGGRELLGRRGEVAPPREAEAPVETATSAVAATSTATSALTATAGTAGTVTSAGGEPEATAGAVPGARDGTGTGTGTGTPEATGQETAGREAGGREAVAGQATATTGDGPAAVDGSGFGPGGGSSSLDLSQVLTLLGLVGVVVGALFFDLDVGLMALSVAVVLSLVAPQSAKGAAEKCAWTTVLLVCGIVTYVNLMERIGTIDYLGDKVTSIDAPLVAALLILFIAALVTAFASTTGILGALIPLAVPFLLSGEVGAVTMVAALAISSSVVDASPFSTSGALVTANAVEADRELVFRRLMAWGFSLVIVVPLLTWGVFVVPGW